MRARVWLLPIVLLTLVAACAPKAVVVPVVSAPKYPDFVEPTVPRELTATAAAENQSRAWRFLQAGDFKNAEREIAAALKTAPSFHPAEATGGYVELAQKDYRNAITRFDRALNIRSDYVPALVGKGQALAALNRDAEAIEVFQQALNIDKSLTDVQRRLEVVKLRTVQREVGNARQAAKNGKTDDAIRAYQSAIASSPESAFLYRELAGIERAAGNNDAALGHYRQANALEPDAASLVAMAELLAARDEFDLALKAYDDALALDPNPTVQEARAAIRDQAEYAKLPAEYRAIEQATQITRADLAALIGQRLEPLLAVTRPRDVGVITDIRGHWAERWILSVARAGVMDPFDNHTFQPRAVVRRIDFAQAITRLLAKIAVVSPTEARRWRDARGRFTDITASHLAYPAASAAIASGVMRASPDGAFEPSRLVTGAEAIEALGRLSAMTAGTRAASDRR